MSTTHTPAPADAAATRGVPYTRRATTVPGHRGWRPLVALIVSVSAWFGFQAGLTALFLEGWVAAQLFGGALSLDSLDVGLTDLLERLSEASASAGPAEFSFLLITIASGIPAVWLGTMAAGSPRFGLLCSRAGRLRWRRLAVAVPISIVAFGATVLIDGAIRGVDAAESAGVAWNPVPHLGLTIAIVVLLVPLQSAAEEYLMRGLGLQVFGAWVRWPWIPVVATSAVFASMHIYNVWGLLAVFAFGVSAAMVTIRTGGLEAAIALHAVNNVAIFLYEAVTSDSSGSAEDSGDWLGFVTQTVILCGGYVLTTHLVERRRERRAAA